MRKSLLVLGLVLGVLTGLAGPAKANDIVSASISATCNSYTINVTGQNLDTPNVTFSVNYTVNVTPNTGTPYTVSDSIPVSPDANLNFSASVTKGVGALNGTFSLSGFATLADSNGDVFNTVAITFTPNPLICGTTPPPPPPCTASATNSSNFNGTSVPASFEARYAPLSYPTIAHAPDTEREAHVPTSLPCCAEVEMRPLNFLRICKRGDRMPARMQAKGQRRVKEGYELPETEASVIDPHK